MFLAYHNLVFIDVIIRNKRHNFGNLFWNHPEHKYVTIAISRTLSTVSNAASVPPLLLLPSY